MKTMNKLTSLLLTLAMVLILAPALGGTAKAEIVNGVTYIDADGTQKTANGVTVVPIQGNTELSAGDWYSISGSSVSTPSPPILTVKDNAHLILCDGADWSCQSLTIYEGCSLTVYGQAGGTGRLTFSENLSNQNIMRSGSSLTVNGGSVTLTGDLRYCLIINSNTTITLNAGNLILKGSIPIYDGSGNGTGTCSLLLNGGSLSKPQTGFNGSCVTVTIREGLTYVGTGGKEYSGSYSVNTIFSDEQTLTPVIKTWAQLQTLISATNNAKITLTQDLTAESTDSVLRVPTSNTVTLDLNGHVVNRGKSGGSSGNDNNAITVEGSLTLIDSSPTTAHTGFPPGGVITGGNGIYHGGGVYVDGGTFNMNGGTIFGNSASTGGGVYMYSGTFTMNGGTIRSNSATSYGGGVYTYGGTFNMNGGMITNNTTSDGGGVHTGGTFKVSGSPQIAGNTKGGAENNVYVSDSGGGRITVAGALTPYNANAGIGAHIGISLWSNSGGYTFTQGNAVSFTSDTANAAFFADNSTGYYVTTDYGQARLSPNAATAPTITTQPSSPDAPLAYGYASSGVTLSLAVSAATGASYGLSYQWYKGNSADFTPSDDTKLDGATGSSYTVPTGLTVGIHYYKCVATATRTDNGLTASVVSAAAAVQVGWSVGVTAGAGMTLSSGVATQTVVSGAMTDVVYTANDGYYFPMDYSASSNGVSAVWNSYTQITVSGTPTANVALELTVATAKEKETTPTTASFAATGYDTGTLSGLDSGMKYSTDGTNWTDVSSDADITLTGLTAPCTIFVVKKGNGSTTTDSDAQEISVTRAETPNLTVTQPTTDSGKGSVVIPSSDTVTYERSANGTDNWTDCSAGTLELDQGSTVYIRVKASGATLASANQKVMIMAPPAAPTFNPAGGRFTSAQSVSIGCATEGVTIYYTLDGTDPTTSSETYGEPISVSETTTLKAVAVNQAGVSSEITKETYTFPYPLRYDYGEGGSGSMTPEAVYDGDIYTFPKCGFTPPENQGFVHWEMSGVDGSSGNVDTNDALVNGIFKPGSTVKIASNCVQKGVITVTACWKDMATVTTAPMAKDLTYNSAGQELVTAGEYEGGSMQYALGTNATTAPTEGWSKTIPTGKNAGTYYVWYRVVGDDDHSDTEPKCVEAAIASADSGQSVTGKTLNYTGQPQPLVTGGTVEGGTLEYALGTDDVTPPASGWSEDVPTGTDPGTYYVWYRVVGDKNHNDVAPVCIVVTITAPVAADTPVATTDQPQSQADYTLLVSMKTSGKTALKLGWTQVSGAEGYDVFFGKCGEGECAYKATTTGLSYKIKGLKKGVAFKAYVRAWKIVDGAKAYIGAPSPDVHTIAGGKSNRYTNAKKISVKKKKLTLNVGGSKKIKAKLKKVSDSRNFLGHVAKVRYYSSNRAVATVNAKGKVTAVGAGKCTVYAVAENGLRVGVQITVR